MKKLYIVLLVLSNFLFFDCEKGYLDEPKPTESVNEAVIFDSRDGVTAFISGILIETLRQFERTDAWGLF